MNNVKLLYNSLIFAQCYFVLYYTMCVSISATYWTSDDEIHDGIWKTCSYGTNTSMRIGNETSFGKATCCTAREFKGYIGATGFFFIAILLIDFVAIIILPILTFSEYKYMRKTIAYIVANSVCNAIVLSVYGVKNGDPTTWGWSYFLAMGSFVLRMLTNIRMIIYLKKNVIYDDD